MVFSNPQFSLVQSLSHIWLFATPWTAACRASLSITNSWSLLKLMSIESVMPSNQLIAAFFFFPSFIYISWRLIALHYCSGFCHTLAWISHGCTCVPIPIAPLTSLPTPSRWVFPGHNPWAPVSCIQPGLVVCFTLDSILVSMLFSQNIPPSPSRSYFWILTFT